MKALLCAFMCTSIINPSLAAAEFSVKVETKQGLTEDADFTAAVQVAAQAKANLRRSILAVTGSQGQLGYFFGLMMGESTVQYYTQEILEPKEIFVITVLEAANYAVEHFENMDSLDLAQGYEQVGFSYPEGKEPTDFFEVMKAKMTKAGWPKYSLYNSVQIFFNVFSSAYKASRNLPEVLFYVEQFAAAMDKVEVMTAGQNYISPGTFYTIENLRNWKNGSALVVRTIITPPAGEANFYESDGGLYMKFDPVGGANRFTMDGNDDVVNAFNNHLIEKEILFRF